MYQKEALIQFLVFFDYNEQDDSESMFSGY